MSGENAASNMLKALMVVGLVAILALSQSGITIGFNIQLNDDDSGGNTDNNASFRNPSVVGELRIVSMSKLKEKKRVIEGVGRLQWGKGQENTFMGALAAVMQSIGEDVSYDYLMGVSGAAFRLQIHQPDWCPSAPDAGCGFNCAGAATEALGYKFNGNCLVPS